MKHFPLLWRKDNIGDAYSMLPTMSQPAVMIPQITPTVPLLTRLPADTDYL